MAETRIRWKNDRELRDALTRLADDAQPVAKKSIRRILLKLKAIVSSQKLAGQVLKRQTGNLAASMTTELRTSGKRGVSGILGTNLAYARIHEKGGRIRHPGGTAYFVKDGVAIFVSNEDAKGKRYKRTKAHTIRIPKRPYIQPTFEDNVRTIHEMFKEDILKASKEALKGVK